jgi:hypothetical protein
MYRIRKIKGLRGRWLLAGILFVQTAWSGFQRPPHVFTTYGGGMRAS